MSITAKPLLLLLAIALLGIDPEKQADIPATAGPQYTADAELKLPKDYREWVYLTSDFYAPSDPAKAQAPGDRKFNNIFVTPDSYRAFLETGKWPDKTMLVVDQRQADAVDTNNQKQSATMQGLQIGLAIHVKDEARFPGKWAFFGFGTGASAGKMIPASAGCYSCHAERGAVDTTFVQFYPTLLPIAKTKNTLNPTYLRVPASAIPATK